MATDAPERQAPEVLPTLGRLFDAIGEAECQRMNSGPIIRAETTFLDLEILKDEANWPGIGQLLTLAGKLAGEELRFSFVCDWIMPRIRRIGSDSRPENMTIAEAIRFIEDNPLDDLVCTKCSGKQTDRDNGRAWCERCRDEMNEPGYTPRIGRPFPIVAIDLRGGRTRFDSDRAAHYWVALSVKTQTAYKMKRLVEGKSFFAEVVYRSENGRWFGGGSFADRYGQWNRQSRGTTAEMTAEEALCALVDAGFPLPPELEQMLDGDVRQNAAPSTAFRVNVNTAKEAAPGGPPTNHLESNIPPEFRTREMTLTEASQLLLGKRDIRSLRGLIEAGTYQIYSPKRESHFFDYRQFPPGSWDRVRPIHG